MFERIRRMPKKPTAEFRPPAYRANRGFPLGETFGIFMALTVLFGAGTAAGGGVRVGQISEVPKIDLATDTDLCLRAVNLGPNVVQSMDYTRTPTPEDAELLKKILYSTFDVQPGVNLDQLLQDPNHFIAGRCGGRLDFVVTYDLIMNRTTSPNGYRSDISINLTKNPLNGQPQSLTVKAGIDGEGKINRIPPGPMTTPIPIWETARNLAKNKKLIPKPGMSNTAIGGRQFEINGKAYFGDEEFTYGISSLTDSEKFSR